MLSAHQPLEGYPEIIKAAAREVGGAAQFAGGVPPCATASPKAGRAWSCRCSRRDVIAMSTAVALTHDTFDAALMLASATRSCRA